MKKIITLTLSITIVAVLLFNSSTSNLSSNNPKASEGVSEIAKIENKDVNEIQKTIDDYKQELEDKKNVKSKDPKSTNDFKNIFKNAVFLGDSQSEGLNLYGFLNDSSVIAKKGKTVSVAINDVNTIKNLSPKKVFILFGMNDLIAFPKLSDFAAEYGKLLDAIKSAVPDAKIYVNSPLPAREDAVAKQSLLNANRNEEANTLLKEVCENKDVTFVDIRTILTSDKSLYEGDGLHVKPGFYKVWLDKLSSLK